MLKVVIVDDEKMICSLISQLLDWEELGAKIVGMLPNAHQFIDMAVELAEKGKVEERELYFPMKTITTDTVDEFMAE